MVLGMSGAGPRKRPAKLARSGPLPVIVNTLARFHAELQYVEPQTLLARGLGGEAPGSCGSAEPGPGRLGIAASPACGEEAAPARGAGWHKPGRNKRGVTCGPLGSQ